MLKLKLILISTGIVLALPLRADEKGEEILRQAIATLHGMNSYSADIHTVLRMGTRPPYDDRVGVIQLKKPNLIFVRMGGNPPVTFVSDGKIYHMAFGPEYRSLAVSQSPESFGGLWGLEVDAFFGGEKSLYRTWTATLKGSEMVDGVDCNVVRLRKNEIDAQEIVVGRSDHLIRRAVSIASHDNDDNTATNSLTKIVANPAISPSMFKFAPPPVTDRKPDPQEAGLLPVGQDAPRFERPTPQAGQISLFGALKGKKALLLNFWFYH